MYPSVGFLSFFWWCGNHVLMTETNCWCDIFIGWFFLFFSGMKDTCRASSEGEFSHITHVSIVSSDEWKIEHGEVITRRWKGGEIERHLEFWVVSLLLYDFLGVMVRPHFALWAFQLFITFFSFVIISQSIFLVIYLSDRVAWIPHQIQLSLDPLISEWLRESKFYLRLT